MKVSVQVVVETDGTPAVVAETFSLERGPLAAGTVGLRLDEAKDLLSAVQATVVNEQVKESLAAQAPCPRCGTARRHKDGRDIVVRTLFGTLRLASPRWWHCSCSAHDTATFSPLAAVLRERTTPELVYLEAKFAGLVSSAGRGRSRGCCDHSSGHSSGLPPRVVRSCARPRARWLRRVETP